MYRRLMAHRSDLLQPLGGAAQEHHSRLARSEVHDPHVAPKNAGADAGAERFRAGLFSGETLGVGGGTLRTPIGLRLLDVGKAAFGEAFAIARKRLLDPADVAEIDAKAD